MSTTMDIYGEVRPEVDGGVAGNLGALFTDRPVGSAEGSADSSSENFGVPFGSVTAKGSDGDPEKKPLTMGFAVEVMGLEPTTSTLRTSPEASDTERPEQAVDGKEQVEAQISLFDPDRW